MDLIYTICEWNICKKKNKKIIFASAKHTILESDTSRKYYTYTFERKNIFFPKHVKINHLDHLILSIVYTVTYAIELYMWIIPAPKLCKKFKINYNTHRFLNQFTIILHRIEWWSASCSITNGIISWSATCLGWVSALLQGPLTRTAFTIILHIELIDGSVSCAITSGIISWSELPPVLGSFGPLNYKGLWQGLPLPSFCI